MLTTGTVLVIAPGQGGGERLQQRQLQLHTCGVTVTLATGADACTGVPEFTGAQSRVRSIAIALAASLDHRGQRSVATGQCEQPAVDAGAEGLQPRRVAALLVAGQALVLVRAQRLEQARRIRRIDLYAIAHAQLRAKQVFVDTGQQHRAAGAVLVTRAAVHRLIVPASVADLAARADVE